MLKNSLRKSIVPVALAAVLTLSGCSTISSLNMEKEKSTTSATASADVKVAVDKAKTLINDIPVKGRAPKTGYSREEFGPAWVDVDHNGCDTRNDILKRDLTNVQYKDGTKHCVIASGTLADKYTGKTIEWKRGQDTSAAVQIDHLVSLSDAFQTGAQNISAEQRKQLANDPENLIAADGPANQQKSDSDAASWLPSNKPFRCEYVAKQTIVKAKYGLWMIQAEKDKINEVLKGC